ETNAPDESRNPIRREIFREPEHATSIPAEITSPGTTSPNDAGLNSSSAATRCTNEDPAVVVARKHDMPPRVVADMVAAVVEAVRVVQAVPLGTADGFRTRFLPSITSFGLPTCPTNHVSSKMPGSDSVGGCSEYVTLFFPFALSCTASIAPDRSVIFTSTVPAVANSDFLPACDTERTATTQSPVTSATTDAEAPSLAVIVANDTLESSSTWVAATSRYARS